VEFVGRIRKARGGDGVHVVLGLWPFRRNISPHGIDLPLLAGVDRGLPRGVRARMLEEPGGRCLELDSGNPPYRRTNDSMGEPP
jgi:hypothetical protein